VKIIGCSQAAGRVSSANRYLRSRAYDEALTNGTISQREFATDPCRSLFQRVASWFFPKFTDNGSVNIAKLLPLQLHARLRVAEQMPLLRHPPGDWPQSVLDPRTCTRLA
jgi:hypothetical protein